MPQHVMKSPREVLDYKFDWAQKYLLAGETISSYTITADPGITASAEVEANGVVALWLSGGTDGTDYEVRCQVATSGGRLPERTMRVSVRNR